MSRTTTHVLAHDVAQNRDAFQRGLALTEFVVEGLVILLVFGASVILASSVLRSFAEPDTPACEVAGH